MAVANLPYTYLAKGRYWRFRRGDLDVSLPGRPGDARYHEAYSAFLAQSERKLEEPDRASFAWLIKRFKASAEFRALRGPTQLDYERTLDLIVEELGDQPYKFTTRAMIKAVRDDHAATPRKAHKIKQMISRLYSWADENDLVPEGLNPTEKLKKLKTRSKIITPWSEPEIAMVLAKLSGHLKTAFLLCLYTGQRAEDVVTMEWSAFQPTRGGQDALIRVRQSKTGEPLDIACHPVLRDHLKSVKTQFGGRIVRNAKGQPWTANAFSQALRGVVESIPDMPHDRSPHGLRYAAAGRLEAAGCTIVEASGVLGHRTYQMAMQYLSGRKAAQSALAKQENKS